MRANEIINELSGVKHQIRQPITNKDELVGFMLARGFKLLTDEGNFSRVFDHGDFVVKVYNDKCYDRFIDYCRANPSPNLPKFRGAGVPLPGGQARMIRIERLEPLQGNHGLNTLRSLAKQPAEAADAWELSPAQITLLNTLRGLYANLGENSGCFLDIHRHNVMQRGDTLVVIDPYGPLH